MADLVFQLLIKPVLTTFMKMCRGSIESPGQAIDAFTKEASQNYESHKELVSEVTTSVLSKLQKAETDFSHA